MYSRVMKDSKAENKEIIMVYFQKPTDYGFKEAKYSLPNYEKICSYGFSKIEAKTNFDFLKRNTPLIVEYAKEEEN